MIKIKRRNLYILGIVVLFLALGVIYSRLPNKEEEHKYLTYEKENEVLENVELARDLLTEVKTIKNKKRVEANLDEVVKNENREISRKEAYNAVVTAEKNLSQEDINSARFKIMTLPEEIVIDRFRFNEMLDSVQKTLMIATLQAVDGALESKTKEDVDVAVELYNNISQVKFNDDVQEWVQLEIKPKMEKILNIMN